MIWATGDGVLPYRNPGGNIRSGLKLTVPAGVMEDADG